MPSLLPTPPLQFDVMKSIAVEAGFACPRKRLAIVTESGDSSSSTPPPDLPNSWATTGNCGRDEAPEPREDQRRERPLGRDGSPEPRLLEAAEESSAIVPVRCGLLVAMKSRGPVQAAAPRQSGCFSAPELPAADELR